jgi:hypothetical protein
LVHVLIGRWLAVCRRGRTAIVNQGKFVIENEAPLNEAEKQRVLLALSMLTLVERGRG